MPRTWACPYWKWEERLKIYCECGKLEFPNNTARTEYIERYCGANPGWKCCSLAANLNRDYERRDNNDD